MTQGSKDMAAFYGDIARRINAGELTTASAASQAVKDGLRKALSAHAGKNPLPAAVLFVPWTMFHESRGRTGNGGFRVSVDPAVTRQGIPSVCLTSTARPRDSGSGYLGIKEPYKEIGIADWIGKRIRFSAYVKSENLSNWGGLFLLAMSRTNSQSEAVDFMADRPISGSTDWQQAQIVVDITPQTTDINFGLNMMGSGKLWINDPRVEIVGNDVPTTDDSNVQLFSDYAAKYTAVLDPSEQRDGHPTLKIASDHAPSGATSFYGSHNRHASEYRGHVVRISAWIKTENVGKGARLTIIKSQGPLIHGTTDWKFYQVDATMTPQTRFLDWGLQFDGNGTVWIDDLKIKIADRARAPAGN
jgi:hypothetical protein